MKKETLITRELRQSLNKKAKRIRGSLITWVAENKRDYPWRKTGRTVYEVLIAEILLKRTTATAVARIFNDIIERFPTISHLSSAKKGELLVLLSGLGLQEQRAHSLNRCAHHILEKQCGKIPKDIDELLVVPGLGAYSARAILSFGFNKPVAIVDGNVNRVIGRLFQKDMPIDYNQNIIQQVADMLLDIHNHKDFNYAMIDLGALICRSSSPKCHDCPLNRLCDYYKCGQRPYEKARSTSRLREIRIKKGTSLARLSEMSGVSKHTIINIEANRVNPRLETLKRLAFALNVSLSDITLE